MQTNQVPSSQCAVIGVIDPDAYGAGAYNTGYFELKPWGRLQAIIMAGDFVSTGKLDAKFTVYTDSGGSNAHDVAGAAITQLTQAGTDDNKQAIINLNLDSIAGNVNYTHGRLTVTLTTAGADAAAIVLGFDAKYSPASDNDAATVDEIVTA